MSYAMRIKERYGFKAISLENTISIVNKGFLLQRNDLNEDNIYHFTVRYNAHKSIHNARMLAIRTLIMSWIPLGREVEGNMRETNKVIPHLLLYTKTTMIVSLDVVKGLYILSIIYS